MKIVFGIPHLGGFPGYFFDTFQFLDKPERSSVIRAENKAVDTARNMIVESFLANPENTHLFFMDADMVFPEKALYRLVERDKDIISGTYFARTDTPIPHAYNFDNVDAKGRTWYRSLAGEFREWLKYHPEHHMFGAAHVFNDCERSVVPVDVLATGCLLIKRQVLEDMEVPWFKCWDWTGGGEDFYFCEKAKKLGYQSYVDFGVQCGHEARLAFMGRHEFMEAYGIDTPLEHDFKDPVYIEANPRGRQIRLGVNLEGFTFPEEVEGYIHYDEGRHLWELACNIEKEQVVVELGSYKGKSALCMAQSGRDVYCIDWFEGEVQYANLPSTFDDHATGNYTGDFFANTKAHENIKPVKANTSDSVFETFVHPIGLLFIDASHEYEDVKRDFELWSRHVVPDGLVAFDDANWPGVEKLISELGSQWKFHSTVGKIAVLERRHE